MQDYLYYELCLREVVLELISNNYLHHNVDGGALSDILSQLPINPVSNCIVSFT